MFNDNKNFYPTPIELIIKLYNKLDKRTQSNIKNVLEPSAGKGDILDFLNNGYRNMNFDAIEQDSNLVSILKGKKYNVIDFDFLEYNGSKFYDLIIMNPPFDNGDKHLLKAIEIMYSGDILCILNAETLKNPYSNTRKLLRDTLSRLNANIEYVSDAFIDAERKTGVEVALIHININNSLETDLNIGLTQEKEPLQAYKENMDVTIAEDKITALVNRFNTLKEVGKETIVNYYKNSIALEGIINLNITNSNVKESMVISDKIKLSYNAFIEQLKSNHWDIALKKFDFINQGITHDTRYKIAEEVKKNNLTEFTYSNIQRVIKNVADNYESFMTKDVVKLFDKITHQYAWTKETEVNRLHFNSWKTNESFKVNNKFILPMYSGAFFDDNWKKYQIEYRTKDTLNDIDKVMNYIANEDNYISIASVIETGFKEGITKGMESTFFRDIKVFKKGTIHLTFKDDSLLRKFNIIAGRERGFLPNEYAKTDYNDLSEQDKELVKEFDGNIKTYQNNMLNNQKLLRIA